MTLPTLDKLRRLPNLAADVLATRATPHRDPDAGGGVRTGSPMPAEVAAWDMLRLDEHGLLDGLIVAAVAVAEARELTPPAARWADVCAFLVDVVPFWRDDDELGRPIDDATDRAHEAFTRWLGDATRALVCPRCGGGPVDRVGYGGALDAGDGYQCRDCRYTWHAAELAHQATLETPATLPDIAELLGIPERTLRRWAKRGKLRPYTRNAVTSSKRPALYLPSEAKRAAEATRTA